MAPQLVELGQAPSEHVRGGRVVWRRSAVLRAPASNPRVVGCRHQRLYSLLDRLRLATAPGSRGPCPPATSHPLDGEGSLALETVSPDKVSVRR